MGKEIEKGDLVIRSSYGGDTVFQVVQIFSESGVALLRGYKMRLMADAPLEDLELYVGNVQEVKLLEDDKAGGRLRHKRVQHLIEADHFKRQAKTQPHLIKRTSQYGHLLGVVLHLDGDKRYLEQCLIKYDELNITAYGYYIDEEEQPNQIQGLLRKHRPDVLVITGHDGMKRKDPQSLDGYHSSRFFVEAVHRAREIEVDKDSLVIFAGACQSFFEALIEAGANFASSPERINIHTFDPLKIAEVVVQTSVQKFVSLSDVIENSITGIKGIGGIESRGKMRLTLPGISKGNE